MSPHPQYDAWRRIKSDTRYLEVPDYLKKQIEKLESTIHDYIEYRYKANVEVQTILNNTLIENGLSKCEISIQERFYQVIFWKTKKLIFIMKL